MHHRGLSIYCHGPFTDTSVTFYISKKTFINQSIVLALSACYYVRLDKDNRETYLTEIGGLLNKLVGTFEVEGKDFLKQELTK